MQHKILFKQTAVTLDVQAGDKSALPDGIDFEGVKIEDDDFLFRFYGNPDRASKYPEQLTLVLTKANAIKEETSAEELYADAVNGVYRRTTINPRPRFFEARIVDVPDGLYDLFVIASRS